MRFILMFTCLLLSLFVKAQNNGLVAYYSFDNDLGNTIIDDTGNGSNGFLYGDTTRVCGVKGKALRMDGVTNYALLLGEVNNRFNGNFSVSFYFKSTSRVGVRDIISKKEDCNANRAFSIVYTASTGGVNSELSESDKKLNNITGKIDKSNCWHHVVVTVNVGIHSLYVDGVLQQRSNTSNRVALSNNAPLSICNSPCSNSSQGRFAGYIDELKVYNVPIALDEIKRLYVKPDQIINRDTVVYAGGSVKIRTSQTCANRFSWQPQTNVDNPLDANTTLRPTTTTTYRLSFEDPTSNCTVTDSIRISVVDKNSVECGELYLPTAFTPNGDGRNDSYGISNPSSIESLTSFEILDRWGGSIFTGDTPFSQWDGNYYFKPALPGVYVYRIRYKCSGQEKTKIGSFTLMK